MQGKTVVITGGTSGIGEIAAQMGTRIVLIARSKARGRVALEIARSKARGRVALEMAWPHTQSITPI